MQYIHDTGTSEKGRGRNARKLTQLANGADNKRNPQLQPPTPPPPYP